MKGSRLVASLAHKNNIHSNFRASNLMYSPTPPLPPNMLHTTITHATTYLVFIFSTTSLDYSFATHKILGPAFHHPFLLISRGIHLNLGSEEKSALVKTDSHLSPLATSGLLC